MRNATWKDWASITVFVFAMMLILYSVVHGYTYDPSCTPRPFSC